MPLFQASELKSGCSAALSPIEPMSAAESERTGSVEMSLFQTFVDGKTVQAGGVVGGAVGGAVGGSVGGGVGDFVAVGVGVAVGEAVAVGRGVAVGFGPLVGRAMLCQTRSATATSCAIAPAP